MLKESTLGLVRHVLTYVGGILTAQGITSESEGTALAAAVATIVGIAWSVYQKKQTAK